MDDERREKLLDMVAGFNARCDAIDRSIAAKKKRIRELHGEETSVGDQEEVVGLRKENGDLKKQNEALLREGWDRLKQIGELQRALEEKKSAVQPSSSIFGPNWATGMPRGLGGAGVQPAEVLLQKDLDELREKYRVLELSMQGMVYHEKEVRRLREENFELKRAKVACEQRAERFEQEVAELKARNEKI